MDLWTYCLWWHRWGLCINLTIWVSSMEDDHRWLCWMSHMPAETNPNPLCGIILQGRKRPLNGKLITSDTFHPERTVICPHWHWCKLYILLSFPDSSAPSLSPSQHLYKIPDPCHPTQHCHRPRKSFNIKRQRRAHSHKLSCVTVPSLRSQGSERIIAEKLNATAKTPTWRQHLWNLNSDF